MENIQKYTEIYFFELKKLANNLYRLVTVRTLTTVIRRFGLSEIQETESLTRISHVPSSYTESVRAQIFTSVD